MKQTKQLSNYLACLVLMSLVAPIALAGEQNVYDRIQLSAQAVADVENDTVLAVMYARREGSDASKLATEVNRIMTQAIKRCKQVKAVEAQTLGYQTTPVYEKQHLTGWRMRQSLQLKSRDNQALSQLIGSLQDTLMLESMSYEVSQAKRNEENESLIGKAIAVFRQRAQDITRQLGRKRYRLVRMQVDTGGVPVQPVRMQLYQAYAEANAPAPAIETGKQRISVTVSGEIELLLN